MFTGIISFLAALFKAIPVLTDLWEKFSKKRTEVTASERLETKNSSVDAGIDAVLRGVPEPNAEQLGKVDEKTGLSTGSTSGPGVVPGRPENN